MTVTTVPESTRVRPWPLLLIALPAAVAIWSGWVGLGELAGFGVVHPLPGIWDGLSLNTAITLPVGMEAYGAYALGAWLVPGTPDCARKFARRSAVGALVLGMFGQVVYHLLSAAGADHAPWPVVALVSCLPVSVLGFAAALTHLLRTPETAPESAEDTAESTPAAALVAPVTSAPAAAPSTPRRPGPRPVPPRPRDRSRTQVTAADAEREFAAELAAGKVPSVRQVKARMRVGHPRAQALRDHLETVAGERVAA